MIGDLIGEWIKGILIDGIMGNLSGLFNTVNTKVGEIASDVGSTPQDWNGGIFSMLQNLSETVIVPIAAAILALVMCYELIDMIVEKNNMHDFDSSMFFRWMARIMIVEDNQGTNKAICEYLKTAGHTLFPALDGEEALNIFRDNSIDLAVLDIMLPKMSGVTILHEIRKISNIPVVMLTAVDDEYTQSNSFDELADDYITKPFSMLILGKRITALLRRSENKSTVSTIRLGNVTVDFAGYTAHDENGKIDITPKELEILKVLIENKGLVLSRNQILDDVWGYDCDVIDRTIDAYIRNIRKKLRLDCITTVKGIGYKFEMENHYENKAIL